MKAAVVQMVSGKAVEVNLERARESLREAARQGAALAVLPENFALFGGAPRALAGEEAEGTGPVLPFLAAISRELNMWLVAGTVPLLAPHGASTPANKVYAASTLWSPAGEWVARYDKCHLFDVDVADGVGRYRESDTYAPGQETVCATLPECRIGLSVCYDLRFPELYRRLSVQGAQAFAVPSAFTYTTGKAHWEVLLRARAIENQSYVLAANQGGEHDNGRVTWGHSCIIDPWGEVVAVCKTPGDGIALAELDLARLVDVRTRMPSLAHRRFCEDP